MQITADLIDWAWAMSAGNARTFLFDYLEDDDEAEANFHFSCYDLPGGWGDSATRHGEICDILNRLAKSGPDGDRCRAMLAMIAEADHKIDALGLAEFPDEGFIALAGPESLGQLLAQAQSLDALGLDAEARSYLEQWWQMAEMGHARGLGLLVHIG